MSRPSPDWKTLNAYVDGELEAAEAGRVAEAAGSDPAVAAQIAALYRLKGLVRSAVPSPPAGLAAGIAAPVRRPRGLAVAAVLAATIVVGGSLWLTLEGRPRPELPQAAMRTARALHERWLGSGSSGETTGARVLAALSDFGSMPVVPDLTGTGLTIGFVANATRDGHRILQVGYRGRHGCHLSMFVFNDLALPQAAAEIEAGGVLAYGWQARQLGYLLFAEGMDGNRFDLIGREVERATRAGKPLDRRDQIRLAQNKRESASCKA